MIHVIATIELHAGREESALARARRLAALFRRQGMHRWVHGPREHGFRPSPRKRSW